MSYIDIAIIVIVVLGALIGLWKGFFKTLISFFGWIVSFLIAFFCTKPVAGALLDVKGISNFVVGGETGWSLYSWIYNKLPALDSEGILATLLKPLINISESVGGSVTTNVALLLANGIFSIIVCIGLLIAIRLILLLFTMFANAMTKNRFVGALNRLLGLVLGAVKGGAFVAIVMAFMTFLLGFGFMSPVRDQIDNSVIAKPAYEQVTKLTNKFIGGNNDTLIKLLDIYEKNRKGDSDDKEEEVTTVAIYECADAYDDGITTTLELKSDNTFVITHGEEKSEGTYTSEGSKYTFTEVSQEGETRVTEGTIDGDYLTYLGKTWKNQNAEGDADNPDGGEEGGEGGENPGDNQGGGNEGGEEGGNEPNPNPDEGGAAE